MLAIAKLTECLGDGTGELDGLLRSNSDVEVRAHALAVREASPGQHVESM
jgi:hypothetical protein